MTNSDKINIIGNKIYNFITTYGINMDGNLLHKMAFWADETKENVLYSIGTDEKQLVQIKCLSMTRPDSDASMDNVLKMTEPQFNFFVINSISKYGQYFFTKQIPETDDTAINLMNKKSINNDISKSLSIAEYEFKLYHLQNINTYLSKLDIFKQLCELSETKINKFGYTAAANNIKQASYRENALRQNFLKNADVFLIALACPGKKMEIDWERLPDCGIYAAKELTRDTHLIFKENDIKESTLAEAKVYFTIEKDSCGNYMLWLKGIKAMYSKDRRIVAFEATEDDTMNLGRLIERNDIEEILNRYSGKIKSIINKGHMVMDAQTSVLSINVQKLDEMNQLDFLMAQQKNANLLNNV